MLNGAMLGLMEQLALDIITLTGETDEEEFFASHLTRRQTLQLLSSMAQTAADLPPEVCERLRGVDWISWGVLRKALARPDQHPLQIWVAIKELTPITLHRLKEYRRIQPKLFSIVP